MNKKDNDLLEKFIDDVIEFINKCRIGCIDERELRLILSDLTLILRLLERCPWAFERISGAIEDLFEIIYEILHDKPYMTPEMRKLMREIEKIIKEIKGNEPGMER